MTSIGSFVRWCAEGRGSMVRRWLRHLLAPLAPNIDHHHDSIKGAKISHHKSLRTTIIHPYFASILWPRAAILPFHLVCHTLLCNYQLPWRRPLFVLSPLAQHALTHAVVRTKQILEQRPITRPSDVMKEHALPLVSGLCFVCEQFLVFPKIKSVFRPVALDH